MRLLLAMASSLVGVLSLSIPGAAFAQAGPPAPPPPPPIDTTPPAPHPPPRPLVDFSTLERLRDQGILSQEEYDSAMKDIGGSTGLKPAASAGTLVVGKWATTLYGFIEGDTIYDSTQSFTDLAGNAPVLRASLDPSQYVSNISGLAPNSIQPQQPSQQYLGTHGQLLFSVRNSRLGFRLHAPGTQTVHTNAMVEMDFLGNQPSGVSQASYFTNPTLRLRHAMFRVETPIVDIMVGQYWHLYGWMEGYMPNTTEIQGVPGQLYARAPQVRISKTFKGKVATLDIAIAAVRPPSLSEVPEGEAGIRLAINEWQGMHTAGATATGLAPLSIAITGDVRYFEIPEAASVIPTSMVNTTAKSVAADLLVPIIPASDDKRGNALTLMAQGSYGNGIADLYANMNSGVQFPFVPNPIGTPTPAWPTNIDQGLVDYDINPGGFALHPIQWSSVIAGLEYYLPGLDGKVWISGNFSHMTSNNSSQFARALSNVPNPQEYFYPTATTQVRQSEDWVDGNIFFDPVNAVRVGLEFASFMDHYVDGYTATNYRAQASGFFIF